MAFIRRKILRRESFNALSLAQELEVNRKTVGRDIEFMRDRLGYEIEFDGSKNSFVGKVPALPVL
jgi:predicted DNA-binding transcriptional regulator YafY